MKIDTGFGAGLKGTVAIALVALGAGCSGSSSPKPTSGEGGTPPPSAWRAAVGAGGTLVQTFDDRAWAARVVPGVAGVDLLGVACVGNTAGWAVGEHGTVVHTLDGGLHWLAQDPHTTVTLRAIRFGDAEHGLLVGDFGTLDVTHDGGATWLTVATGVSVALRGAAVAEDTFLAVGDAGTVLRSVDGGVSFVAQHLAGAGDLRSVAMDPGGHLVLAVDSLGGAWASTDRGATFAREMSAGVPLAAVALQADGTLAVAVGAAGALRVRDSRGAWTSVASGTTADLHAALVEEGAAYIGGDDGTLLAAHDLARPQQWERIATGTRAALWSLDDL